ncbi:hypothetical protein Y032_0198g1603 [Ancylostoma ceylanicum]|uniref:Uncharacterized protein n=1 Tax=Ancylostoma ceylanicum TaxID=53326 RepID=A0A016SNW9_9BILA|nr:hypothetical protein Y032_0198g1603 [Ancylostoma ceylanicum]
MEPSRSLINYKFLRFVDVVDSSIQSFIGELSVFLHLHQARLGKPDDKQHSRRVRRRNKHRKLANERLKTGGHNVYETTKMN